MTQKVSSEKEKMRERILELGNSRCLLDAIQCNTNLSIAYTGCAILLCLFLARKLTEFFVLLRDVIQKKLMLPYRL